MRIAIIAFLILQFNWLVAQQIEVRSSEDQSTLVNATIALTSTNGDLFYLTTDINGAAHLKKVYFKDGSYLIANASYIGFENTKDTIYQGINKVLYLTPKDYLINDVVITAQYAPTSIDKSIHKVNVISRQKIENMAAVNVKDVLSNELNIRISQDNILGAGLSLQGMSGQNVKILIDGVPVIGRMDGQIDLSQINLSNVERIEIVEGPLSVNYGSNALAGTINIISGTEYKEKLSVGLEAYSENIGTYNLEARTAFKLAENHAMQILFGRNYFDGWSPTDDFLPSFKAQKADSSRSKQWNAKEQYFGSLQYHFNYKDLLFSYKGEFFDEKISNLGLPRRSTISFIAFDDYYKTKRIDNALFMRGKLNDNWRINWLAAYNDFERVKEARRKDLVTLESNLIPVSQYSDIQDTSKFNLITSRASISSTKDSSWINYEIGYDINIENAEGKRIENGAQQIGDYAAFVSTEINITDAILLRPALRYSYNTEYNAPLTPSINLKYAEKNSILRLSYAKGFRAPSLKELYFNFDDVNHSLFGNPELKAERSDNYSASIQQKFLVKEVLLKAEIAAFYNKIYDQISLAQSNIETGDTMLYFNVDENQTKGLNLNFSVLYNNLQLNLGASYIGRYNRLADENPIDEFSYSTEFKANVSYELKKPQMTISIFAKHQGELPGFGYNNNEEVIMQTIEGYQMVDATIAKHFLNHRLKMAVGCKNILNVQNIKSSITGGAHTGGGGTVPIGTGRTVFMKLGYHFSKK